MIQYHTVPFDDDDDDVDDDDDDDNDDDNYFTIDTEVGHYYQFTVNIVP